MISFRPRTPSQHAAFLNFLNSEGQDLFEITSEDAQKEFDRFYKNALMLLDKFYPEKTVTISTRDPSFVTPSIKAKLKIKNKLMQAGRIEEANAMTVQIGKEISRQNAAQLSKITNSTNSKQMWKETAKYTKQSHDLPHDSSKFNAEKLNSHYASISTDPNYTKPIKKPNDLQVGTHQNTITEYMVFKLLDTLKITATGLDKLPAWYLRVWAAAFAQPISKLFNISLCTSEVPKQWKTALIRPLPKIKIPESCSDFRPISITPVLSRVLEKIVTREYIYPAILEPCPGLSFSDQFAFRPSGSTTAALIFLLQKITHLLETNTHVFVYAFDFSKAFDTVKHSTLFEKFIELSLPPHIHNWLVDFFSNRLHCTSLDGVISTLKEITASIIQGSGLGPVAYSVNASDLHPINIFNSLCKFADDTYLIVAGRHASTRVAEIEHVQKWAAANNLCLNHSKSAEIIFIKSRLNTNIQFSSPQPILGIPRVNSIKILGVTISDKLSISDHIRTVIGKCAQSLYALKMLRAHGLNNQSIQSIFNSIIRSKLLYASPAWSGFCKQRRPTENWLISEEILKICFRAPRPPFVFSVERRYRW